MDAADGHDLKTLPPIGLNVSLFLVVFATGLGASVRDATYLFRSAAEPVGVLLAMSVLMSLFVGAWYSSLILIRR